MGIKRVSGWIKDEKGSTSILIVLMMIVLVSIGYFTIAAANANARLGSAALEWNRNFYYLDGQGERFVAYVDALLLEAQRLANEYFESGSQTNFTHDDLPVEVQTGIREGYNAAGNNRARLIFVEETIDMLFFFYAEQTLTRLNEFYPGAVVSVLGEEFDIRGIVCDITLIHPNAPEYNLSITLNVLSHSDFRNEYRLGNTGAARYRITGWLKWQSVADE
ncbi:MAG: hypothetical protein FWE24_09335 [Defluviitaleaceae bacterium]|nr:hypothetical protein [Defluviitaleaceae bacterium]